MKCQAVFSLKVKTIIRILSAAVEAGAVRVKMGYTHSLKAPFIIVEDNIFYFM